MVMYYFIIQLIVFEIQNLQDTDQATNTQPLARFFVVIKQCTFLEIKTFVIYYLINFIHFMQSSFIRNFFEV